MESKIFLKDITLGTFNKSVSDLNLNEFKCVKYEPELWMNPVKITLISPLNWTEMIAATELTNRMTTRLYDPQG